MCVLLIGAVLVAASPVAAQAASELDVLAKASTTLFTWFTSLLGSVSELKASADRDRLVSKLDALRVALFKVEETKRDFLGKLRRDRLEPDEIRQTLEALKQDVDALRARISDVGPEMRAQHRIGGFEAQQQLSEAASTRKAWVEDFQDALRQGRPADPAPILAQGDAAVQALVAAQRALIELIDALRQA